MTEENNLEIIVKGNWAKNEGGKMKIKGLSCLQYEIIIALLRTWGANT